MNVYWTEQYFISSNSIVIDDARLTSYFYIFHELYLMFFVSFFVFLLSFFVFFFILLLFSQEIERFGPNSVHCAILHSTFIHEVGYCSQTFPTFHLSKAESQRVTICSFLFHLCRSPSSPEKRTRTDKD